MPARVSDALEQRLERGAIMRTTVLVVEDDFDTLHPLSELLQLKGFVVLTAADAEHALRLAFEKRPDLIITDIALPGRSGLHFILSVRGNPSIKNTPILVISGCGPVMLVEAESAGADICLEKPIRIDVFWAAVSQMLIRPNVPEPERPPDPIDEDGRTLIREVDRLVAELRTCPPNTDRDSLLRSLKESIFRLQARNTQS
jgi:DNA-binding response OmpR family regulator